MARSTLAAVLTLIAACGFHTGAAPGEAGIADAASDGRDDGSTDGPAVDAQPDSPGSPPGFCNAADLDLRACFTFESSTQDGSSYGHNATSSGVVYAPGHTGQAATTTASSIVIPVSDTNLDLSTFTLKMYIRPVTLPAATLRAGLLDSTGYRMFVDSSGIVRCAFSAGGVTKEVFSATGVAIATWTRVACTYDGSNLRVYFNGAQSAVTSTTSIVDNVTGNMTIGQNEPSGENFNGAIDELQIWGSIVGP